MAAYSELVTLINAYINENGVQAITGRILNGVLNEMVDQLGSGFPIMGSAVPTDNPGTPDSPRAWFASEPGTYTNFGGIVIEEGELALLIYDNGWYKADIGQGGDPNAVQYIEQELTDEERAQARENIGACSAEDAGSMSQEPDLDNSVKYVVQSLDESQKSQARQNIGAGTSNFSGRYNDLSDKPAVLSLSQDILADKNSTVKAPSVKAYYEDAHPAMEYSQPVGGMLPNVFYDLGVLTGGVTVSLAPPPDAAILNHYFFVFRTGETAPTISWPQSIIGWINGGAPELMALTHYEISIINGYAAYLYV